MPTRTHRQQKSAMVALNAVLFPIRCELRGHNDDDEMVGVVEQSSNEKEEEEEKHKFQIGKFQISLNASAIHEKHEVLYVLCRLYVRIGSAVLMLPMCSLNGVEPWHIKQANRMTSFQLLYIETY